MADTIREQIIKHYISKLKTWARLKKNYTADDKDGVFRAVKSLDVDMLPACVVWAQDETAERTNYNKTQCTMTLKVEMFSIYESDEIPAELQEQILGELIQIIADYSSLSALAESVRYTGGGVAEFGAEENVVGVFANFEIIYLTSVGNPFAG